MDIKPPLPEGIDAYEAYTPSYTRPGKRLQFANWKMAQSK